MSCVNKVLQPVWYEGDPTPLNVEDILQEKDDNFNNDQDEDEVFDNNLDSDDEMSE